MSHGSAPLLLAAFDSRVEMVAAYGLSTVIGLVVAKAAQIAVLGWLDPALPRGSEAGASAAGATGASKAPPKRLRAEAVREDLDLTELAHGTMPSADHHAHVAYLTGGVPQVAELLAARAEAEGWLAPVDASTLRVGQPDPWASSLTRELRAQLQVSEVSRSALFGAARTVAERHAEGFERDLVAAGLLRGSGARSAGSFVSIVLGLSLAGGVLLRASVEAEAGRPHLPLLTVFVLALLGTGFIARTGRLSSAGERYLAWLIGATEALRADVDAGLLTAPDDVSLATALEPVADAKASQAG